MAARASTPPLIPPDEIRRRYAEKLSEDEAAALEVLFARRETAHRVDATLAGWLGPDALSPGRWQVLAVLWSRDEAVPQREIVSTLKVSRATVSELVDALAAEGYVVTEVDPKDRRQVRVSLSQEGRQVTERLVRTNARNLRAMFSELNPDELRQTVKCLQKLARWQPSKA